MVTKTGMAPGGSSVATSRSDHGWMCLFMSVCRHVFVHYQGKEVLPLKAGPRTRQEIGRVEMVRMRHTTCAQPSAIALIIALITLISCLPSSSSSPKKVLLTLILALHLILALALTGSRGKEARTTSLWLLTGIG